MARRKGHKPSNRGVRPGTVRGPYAPKVEAAASAAPVAETVRGNETEPPLGLVEPRADGLEVAPEADVESPPVAPMTAPLTARGARALSLYATAQVLRVDRDVVTRWVKKEGAPVVREGQGRGKGLEWEIDLADLWVWWGEHNRRLALAEAGIGKVIEPKDRKTLLEVARLAKLVVPVSVVEHLLAQVLKDARTTLSSIPGRLTRAMVGLPADRVAAFKVQAEDGVADALLEFERALYDIDLSPSEDVVIVEDAGVGAASHQD